MRTFKEIAISIRIDKDEGLKAEKAAAWKTISALTQSIIYIYHLGYYTIDSRY